MHPLVPSESLTLHVERGDSESLIFRGLVKIKELVNLEHPAQRVSAIKPWNVQFDGSGREWTIEGWVSGKCIEPRWAEPGSQVVHLGG